MTFSPLVLDSSGQIKQLGTSEVLKGIIPAVRLSGSTNVPSATATGQLFSSIVFDTFSWFQPEFPRRLDIPIGGIYLIGYTSVWENNSTGVRQQSFTINGVANQAISSVPGSSGMQNNTFLVSLPANSNIQLINFQTSGVTLQCNSNFYCVRFS